jgi:hypothetical protein
MAEQASNLSAAQTPPLYTDPQGRILVGAEHPRTVHERYGALDDKTTAQVLPDLGVTKGQSIKLALPRSIPAGATRLSDADISLLYDAKKGDIVTFDGGTRSLPVEDGTFKDLTKVEIVTEAKNGTLTIKAVE